MNFCFRVRSISGDGRSRHAPRTTIDMYVEYRNSLEPFYTHLGMLTMCLHEAAVFFGTDKDLKVGSTFDSIAISKNHKQKLKSKVSNKK